MANVIGTLAPGFLIASPPLGDPNFDRTVVLLAVHSDSGALGFVINRVAPMTLGELLMFAGYGDAGSTDSSPVYLGGLDPVLWGLAVSFALGIGVSLLTTPPPPEDVDPYFVETG